MEELNILKNHKSNIEFSVPSHQFLYNIGSTKIEIFSEDTGTVFQLGCNTAGNDADVYYRSNGTFNFHTPGSGNFTFSPGGSVKMTMLADGSIGAPTGTNIYNPSDERLKRDVVNLTGCLDKINQFDESNKT